MSYGEILRKWIAISLAALLSQSGYAADFSGDYLSQLPPSPYQSVLNNQYPLKYYYVDHDGKQIKKKVPWYHIFKGIYVGAGVSYYGFQMPNAQTVDGTDQDTINGETGFNSVASRIAIGWDIPIKFAFFGLEYYFEHVGSGGGFLGTPGRLNVVLQDVQPHNSHAILARLGVVFYHTYALYVGAGMSHTSINYTVIDESATQHDFSNSDNAALIAGGIQVYFTRHFAGDLRYTHIGYKEINRQFVGAGGDVDRVRLDPVVNEVTAQLSAIF